jgi:hypothetical protein
MDRFLEKSSGEDMRRLAVQAGKFLENRLEQHPNENMNHVNNATSALCGMVRHLTNERVRLLAERVRLVAEIEELQQRISAPGATTGSGGCCTGNECGHKN